MTRLRDISVRTKLWAGFALAFCLVAVIGLIAVLQLRAHNEFATVLAEITLPEMVLLGDVDREIAEQRALAQRRIETTDFHQLAAIGDAMDAASAGIDASMAAYRAIADAEEERRLSESAVGEWRAYQESLAAVLRRLEVGEVAEGFKQFDAETLPMLDGTTDSVHALIAVAKREAVDAASEVRILYAVFLASIVATTLLAAAVVVGALIWVWRDISLPIRRVSDAMRRLTAGDDAVVIAGDANRKDEIGTLIAAATGYRDSLVEQRRLAREADEERQRFALAVRSMPVGLCLFDADQRLVICNSRYREMYDLPESLAKPGAHWRDLLHRWIASDNYAGDDRDVFFAYLDNIGEAKTPSAHTMHLSDGRIYNIIHQPLAGGGWIATHEEATARYEAEQKIIRLGEQAERERQRLDAAISNMPIGLVMFDAERRLIIANSRYAEMYGLRPELMKLGTPLQTILEERVRSGVYAWDDPVKYIQRMSEVADRGEPYQDVVEFSNGRVFSLVYKPLAGGGWIATHEDITERRRAEAQIAYMAHYDSLTDLPNRILLRKELEEALAHETRADAVGVLYLDLDHFKQVNDTLGHAIGDKLLAAAAKRLAGCAREDDTVGRLGGDEFAVVQVGAEQPRGARTLAERIIAEMSTPFVVDGHQVVIGASIGIAMATADGKSAHELLKNSDMALYRAKTDGRGVYRFFEPAMDAQMQARRRLEIDLRSAVATQAFGLHYQPQVKLATNEITGFEALLRWQHPERGNVPPSEFIPLAEETGLIVPIGEWVLKRACTDARQWPPHIRVAVNLSAVQFRNGRLMKAVVGALDASGLPASRLEVEVTETVLLADTEATLATLHQMRGLGVRISMDDFGTGYSSLSYLQSFPFDKIKIDRRFIENVTSQNNSLAIVRAVTGLSASLGIDTTAEGVETKEQLDRLKSEGCTEVQGFLLGRPMPARDVTALLAGAPVKAVA
ncbi:MAG: EAL domain-containing protein [Bauldia sp.]